MIWFLLFLLFFLAAGPIPDYRNIFFECLVGKVNWTHNFKIAAVRTFHCAAGACPRVKYINIMFFYTKYVLMNIPIYWNQNSLESIPTTQGFWVHVCYYYLMYNFYCIYLFSQVIWVKSRSSYLNWSRSWSTMDPTHYNPYVEVKFWRTDFDFFVFPRILFFGGFNL